jgi:mono/diheme cytochrome c family protein
MSSKIAVAAIAGLVALGTFYSVLHAQTTSSVWDGVYTNDQASRGQPQYNTHCASCHGDQLTGGEMSPPLAGGEFLSNWNGLTVGDLFEKIRTQMPMTDEVGKLSRQINADITAYILSVNKFPAGDRQLPTQTEILKQISIESMKPEKK